MTVFLKVAQRQRGKDQEAFRTALEEFRLHHLSQESWKLLSSRVQAKLDDQEVARSWAKNVGPGAAAAPDDKAGNLAKQIPVCIGARLMLTSNLWQPVGLCNGARGTVYDIRWQKNCPDSASKQGLPRRSHTLHSYAVSPDRVLRHTVHKSQSITEDMIVTDLSCRDFQTGLSYVAVSRVKTLQGLMLDAPFDLNHLTYASPPEGIKMKMRDQQLRKRQVLTQNPYKVGHGSTMAYSVLIASASVRSCSNAVVIAILVILGPIVILILLATYIIVIASTHLAPCLLAHSTVYKMTVLNIVGPVTDISVLAACELMGSIETMSAPVLGIALPTLPQAKVISLHLTIL
ncbi:hypothetical protein HIM_12398 [Hirsutella minnesotensis 3608]|uniref:DNA helicase Pif1-like 2B domain-containing protein n=1 Tax=Hirsutella minnesotensis 3608 TaxID=1043627 RepID=A0A0F7ZEY7_9HYPO|nr:hypothetical protein HIM_12398 [Hirsutella minnesotensis 3608]